MHEKTRPTREEVERKRAALHSRLEKDTEFMKESQELDERIKRGERSPNTIPFAELRKRVREGKKMR